MSRDPSRTVYIGNLDEKVTERVLYELLIQVGRVVDLYIPMDKETNRHKGYAFAEYESEEIANYAVKLFSGLVCLRNKPLRFSMSGQDKSSQLNGTPSTPKSTDRNHYQGSAESTDYRVNARYSGVLANPSSSASPLPRHHAESVNVDRSSWSANRRSEYASPLTPGYSQVMTPHGRFDYGRQNVDPTRVNNYRSDHRHSAYPPYTRR